MADCVTFQEMVNRLGFDKGVVLGIEFDGEYSDGETITGTNGAEAEVVESNNPWVKVRFKEVASPANHFEYNDDLTGSISGKVGQLLFAESTFLNSLIEEATDIIEKETGTVFGDNTLNKTVPFSVEEDQTHFWLGENNIKSIDSITYNGDVQTWVEDTDYWLYLDMGLFEVVAGKVAEGNPKNLLIEITYGEASVPPGIKGVAREMVVNTFEDYQRQRNLGGADQMGMADFSVKFEKRDMLTPEIENRLSKYRKVNMIGV